MRITKFTFIAAMALLSPQAIAGDMYKCSNNGVVSYKHTPCTDSSEQKVIEEVKPSKSDIDAKEQIQEGVLLGPISIKEDHVDRIGNQWIAYKAPVTNNTSSEKQVFIRYKGIDSGGFMVDDIYLSGTIPALSFRYLTNQHSMATVKYERISQWVRDH